MRKKGHLTAMEKAIRLEDTWDTFLNEHPELTVEQRNGKVFNIIFPSEAENRTLVILENIPNNVYYLSYSYFGEIFTYEAPEAKNSLLYRLLEV